MSLVGAIALISAAFFLLAFLGLYLILLRDLLFSQDLSGGAKLLWVLGLVLFPLIGSAAYIFVRGDTMPGRELQRLGHPVIG